jgi:hypothetical protein
MHPIILKTFGGLTSQYYFRQFLFGLIFAVPFSLALFKFGLHRDDFNMLIIIISNTILYPYARSVYEGVVNFIVGSNVFFVNAVFALFFKLMIMMICWSFAIFIAPVGLAYLYYYHIKNNGSI